MMQANAPLLIMKETQKLDQGRKVRGDIITVAKALSDTVMTCLGPKAMLKMLMDPMGGIVLTNDGNAILREITVQHPAAKSLIEVARTQDEEVGDGTTSAVILAGHLLSNMEQFLDQKLHPLHVIKGIRTALDDALELIKTQLSLNLDLNNQTEINKVIKSCLGTKISSQWGDLVSSLAWKAVSTVSQDIGGGKFEIDIKRYARVEKIPGGSIEESCVLNGIVLNKDVLHPSMKRKIMNPRILLLDCGLEYKKGESQTNVEILKDEDFNRLLELEEEAIKNMCSKIIEFKPTLVITEKGCADLAMYYLSKAGITVLRRVKKMDNNRIAKATGATIVNQIEDITAEDIGTGCGLYEVKKIGDEYFSYITECQNPKACSIILRGASKDILNEIDRNLHDALCVARNIILDPRIVTGGGSLEMALATALEAKASKINQIYQLPYIAAAKTLEIIPSILIKNCGQNPIRTITELRAKHLEGIEKSYFYGIDGETGKIADMKQLGIYDSTSVRSQVLKVAFEVSILLLRIDDIVSGTKKESELSQESSTSSKPITA